MKIKRYTITSAELNSGVVLEYNAYITEPYTTVNESSGVNYFYPKEIEVYNDSSGDVGINIMASEDEYDEYVASSPSYTNHDFKRIPHNFNYGNDRDANMKKPYKVLIKGTSGHSKSIYLELIGLRINQVH